jgi:hypothetical protein
MPRAFHVDRSGQLQPGLALGLTKPAPVDGQGQLDLQTMRHIDAAFPNGLSRFGFDYLIGRLFLTGTEETSQETDLIFELVRRFSFPDRPSRYASIFGSSTLEEALRFRADFGEGVGTIWEIEADSDPFRADHEHLELSGTPVDVWMRAESYWRGDGTSTPAWELLFNPPVTVVGQAQDLESA